MIAPTIVGISSIIFSIILTSQKTRPISISLAFLPILIFLSLRYNYGNDYKDYFEIFKEISALYEMTYDADYWHSEIGWLFLNRIFSVFGESGFFIIIAVLAIFNCYVYVRFIKKFVPEKYYWLAILLYVFVPDNMLIQSSAMRQSVSISLFILAAEQIINRNILKYAAYIYLGSLFHSSALILLPIYIIGMSNISIKKSWIPFFIGLYIFLFYASNQTIDIIQKLLSTADSESFVRRYSAYEEKGTLGSGLGVIFYGIYLSILLLLHDKESFEVRILYRLVIVGIYLLPFTVQILMLSRVVYYFSIFSIAAIPIIATKITSTKLRIVFIFAHSAYSVLAYRQFFENEIWKKAFSEYNTILGFVF
jgi:hypothetical protein